MELQQALTRVGVEASVGYALGYTVLLGINPAACAVLAASIGVVKEVTRDFFEQKNDSAVWEAGQPNHVAKGAARMGFDVVCGTVIGSEVSKQLWNTSFIVTIPLIRIVAFAVLVDYGRHVVNGVLRQLNLISKEATQSQ